MYNLVDRDLSWVLQLYPLAVLSRHLLALLLSDGGALLLSFVLGHGPRHLLALLPGRILIWAPVDSWFPRAPSGITHGELLCFESLSRQLTVSRAAVIPDIYIPTGGTWMYR